MKAANKKLKPVSALEALIKTHDGIRRRGEYEILGQVETIECAAGAETKAAHFFGTGPVIARSNAKEDRGAIIVLTEFKGFPDVIEVGEEHCPDCLAECDVCKGKGKVPCSLVVGCRGSGEMKIPMGLCECTARTTGKTGPARKSCRKCKGEGQLYQMRKCDGCKGTKKEMCNQCRGARHYATGKAGGSTKPYDKLCATCNGTQRNVLRTPQPVEKFAQAWGERGAGLVIQAVRRLTWQSMELDAKPLDAVKVCEIMPDSNGQLMSLFVDPASNIYCAGGVPRMV